MRRFFLPALAALCLLPGCDSSGAPELRFAALGATGTGGEGQHAVAGALAAWHERERLDFVLLLGDNFRPAGVTGTGDPLWETRFSEVYARDRLPVPFLAAAGDRDHDGDIDAQIRYAGDDRWDMPGRYYRSEYRLAGGRSVELYVIDTTRLREPGNPDVQQLAWLSGKLAASTADWRIVAGHHGILRVDGRQDHYLSRTLLPLLQDHAVDVYLSGREHVLAFETDPAGLLHVTSGAGALVSDPRPSPGIACLSPRQGFVAITAGRRELRLAAVDRDGQVHCTQKTGGRHANP
jgi:acid phosphatase